MACYGVDADAAFAVVSRLSSSSNQKLRALAVNVVEAVSSSNSFAPGPRPSPCDPVRSLIEGGPAIAEPTPR